MVVCFLRVLRLVHGDPKHSEAERFMFGFDQGPKSLRVEVGGIRTDLIA
jgi:hypothetical protein